MVQFRILRRHTEGIVEHSPTMLPSGVDEVVRGIVAEESQLLLLGKSLKLFFGDENVGEPYLLLRCRFRLPLPVPKDMHEAKLLGFSKVPDHACGSLDQNALTPHLIRQRHKSSSQDGLKRFGESSIFFFGSKSCFPTRIRGTLPAPSSRRGRSQCTGP